MNNAMYVKTTENVKIRIDVKLVNRGKNYLKCISKLSYMSQKIFDNNFVSIRKIKPALKLNKPAYIGMCMLELSKVLMYEFYYNYIKNKYGNKTKLLFTDTDLMYENKTEDVYEDFNSNKKLFDFSNYGLSQNTMMIQTN